MGFGRSDSNVQAFRWTAEGGMIGLGDLPGGNVASMAEDVSADGAVVVGGGHSASGREAFRWTSTDGMVGLGDLEGGLFGSWAYGVSDNGLVVVGESDSASGEEAFRWTAAEGMVGLGDFPGREFRSYAQDASNDGSIIVGFGTDDEGVNAAIWDNVHGMRKLKDVLINDYGLESSLDGWRLIAATDISPDGLYIVGYGTGPSGGMEPWIASLAPGSQVPEPGFFVLLGSAGLGLSVGGIMRHLRRKAQRWRRRTM
ncbi:hypothetical protein JCM19992_07120 [Thermostilla marina]